MVSTIQILVLLLAANAAIAVLAVRLSMPSSILLVSIGVVLALIPGLPGIEIAPDFVLLVLLPPIYSSAVSMSWREFRFNLRPITLLAFGCVVFTTVAVAVAAQFVLSVPWSVGFLLGAIVSPPDAVAPLAIARRLGLPQAHPPRPRGRGPGERRHRAHPVPLPGGRGRDGYILSRARHAAHVPGVAPVDRPAIGQSRDRPTIPYSRAAPRRPRRG
jgi:hypothetical protein